MYEEFIVGYIISSVAVILLAVVIVLQCIILKKLSRNGSSSSEASRTPYSKGSAYSGANRRTAICRNCATQFEAAHSVCPKCGTPR